MPDAGRDHFQSNFCRFPHEELQRGMFISPSCCTLWSASERADLRGLIRMTGVRPCPCGHSSTLEGPWSTCGTQPALPQNVAARLFPSTCHGVAFLPRCSVSPESAAQQSEVKLGDWCAGCVVACPTPSVSDMLH